jgi:hypothetical protein
MPGEDRAIECASGPGHSEKGNREPMLVDDWDDWQDEGGEG